MTANARLHIVLTKVDRYIAELGKAVADRAITLGEVADAALKALPQGEVCGALATRFRRDRDRAMAELAEGPASDLLLAIDELNDVLIPVHSGHPIQQATRQWINRGLDLWGPIDPCRPDDILPTDAALASWRRDGEDLRYELRAFARVVGRQLDEEQTFMPIAEITEFCGDASAAAVKCLQRFATRNPGHCLPVADPKSRKARVLLRLSAARAALMR